MTSKTSIFLRARRKNAGPLDRQEETHKKYIIHFTEIQFSPVLPSSAQFCPVFPSFIQFFSVLLSFSSNFTQFRPVSPSFAQFCPVLPSFAQFCAVLPSFAQFCPVFFNFSQFCPELVQFEMFQSDWLSLIELIWILNLGCLSFFDNTNQQAIQPVNEPINQI